MPDTCTPLRHNLSDQALAFNRFLQKTQKNWATSLIAHEKRAQWHVEHRPLEHHDSLIYHIADGDFLEKAGINYSLITGDSLPVHATQRSMQPHSGKPFVAMGISTILHPKNPYIPSAHCNLRYFQTMDDDPIWWFAGVMDLTPIYGFDEDCRHWHQTCEQACLHADNANYDVYKKACDDYYYLPHRREHRGIGGLWIEQHNRQSFAACQRLIESVGHHFLQAYLPIVQRRCDMSYSQPQRDFQSYRRTRYVEFNLLYDRGTKFGLSMGSRAESILISMPPQASWPYNWQADPGSDEEKLTRFYLQPRDWR